MKSLPMWMGFSSKFSFLRIPKPLVEANQVLAVMTNNDLMVEIQNLRGELQQNAEQIKKLSRAQSNPQLTKLESQMIEGELAEAMKSHESLQRQLELKDHEADLLEVKAPARGRIVNWQLRQNLLRRPVQRGQNLMTLVAPDTPWQIELEFPERRVSHLMRAETGISRTTPREFHFSVTSRQRVSGTFNSHR